MLKPMLSVAATGVVAFLLWKVIAILLLPFLGVALGVALMMIKIVFLAGALLMAMWIYRRMVRREASAG